MGAEDKKSPQQTTYKDTPGVSKLFLTPPHKPYNMPNKS
jgi:hypothetical protein